MKKKHWYILAPFLTAALIFFDQLTKYLARRDLVDEPFTIIDKVFKLKLLSNQGAAWGMLQGRVSILSFISIALMGLLVYFFIKIPEDKKFYILRVLFIFVFAGALGNLIDRFYQGYVTDFLYIELIDFPIFNVADVYITFAMFGVFLLIVFIYKEEDLEFFTFGKPKNKSGKNDIEQASGEECSVEKESVIPGNKEQDSTEQENTDKNTSEV
ncbi:MAG: signal peptidase II [Lachnospiraceae bacterium]|nr:signal peptidase II [Lachnospiraceae bacterium]